jgi:hypothetical protein
MIYTDPYAMLLMRANPLETGRGLGPGVEIKTFLGPVKWHRALVECHLGPKKVEISRDQTPPTCPHQKHYPGTRYRYVQGRINHMSKFSFIYMSFRGLLLGFGGQ